MQQEGGNLDPRSMSPDERQQMFTQMRDTVTDSLTAVQADQNKKSEAILTPAQTKRLRELDLQWRGPLALSDEKLADKVTLTPDQRAKFTAMLKELRDTRMKAQTSMFSPGGGGFPGFPGANPGGGNRPNGARGAVGTRGATGKSGTQPTNPNGHRQSRSQHAARCRRSGSSRQFHAAHARTDTAGDGCRRQTKRSRPESRRQESPAPPHARTANPVETPARQAVHVPAVPLRRVFR